MGWIMALILALGALILLVLPLRLPRKVWPVAAAGLLVGLAGYGWQGSPDQHGSPREPQVSQQDVEARAELLISMRQKLSERAPMADRTLLTSDALLRHGEYANAVEVLRVELGRDPGNADAWVMLGNALVAHGEGNLTPAAVHAYSQAAKAAPDRPGPPFFLGLALAESGRLEEGRALWAQVLARAPANAPWRAELAERLAQLDAFIARQAAEVPAEQAPG